MLDPSTAGPSYAEPADNVAGVAAADTLTPADRYEELFVDVQMGSVFADSKTFVDCAPRGRPADILQAYRRQRGEPGFSLSRFVEQHFDVQDLSPEAYVSNPEQSLTLHIEGLWSVLTRQPHQHPPRSSLLPLAHAYAVPGGRFAELYYWDSYFLMLGLAVSGRRDLLKSMADNFAYLIDTYGHVPNANRSYYLSRSQPPVFAFMVELFEEHGVRQSLGYLPQLLKEYAYWMDGAGDLRPGEAHRRVVRLPDGALLNRYWDDRDTPRDEAYREDVLTARRSPRHAHEVYRDLRAGAESGWDFSSRWLDDPARLDTIRTTAILPVDLNSFLYKLETLIAQLSADAGQIQAATGWRSKARARRNAIHTWLWNDEGGAFFDYDWQRGALRSNLTAATVAPLATGVASAAQAQALARTVSERLLDVGGLATTEIFSGQQWDSPNGWAPLQWLAIDGLRRYGYDELASTIAHRWLATVARLYRRESKLVEKYRMPGQRSDESGGGDGGEYPLQDGFGWTNGVTRRLIAEYPQHEASRCCAAASPAIVDSAARGERPQTVQ